MTCSEYTPPYKKLSDVVDFINGDRGKNYPSQNDFHDSGIPFIGTQHIVDGRLDHDALRYITKEKFDQLRGGRIKKHDLIYTLRGNSIGRVGLLTDIDIGSIASSVVIVRSDNQLDARFLYYVLSSGLGQEIADSLDNGSAQPNISVTSLGKQKIPFPDPKTRHSIAHVLGTLDDKIELNRRMNATLEAMSRAIFKSWFVDFDPVRQKAAGKQPVGMDAETAALFPDSFEDSELGEVPTGWEVKEIREVISLSRESLKPADHPDESFAHYSLPAFDSGQWPANDLGSGIKSQKLIVQPGCVLISKLNPRTPRVWLPQQGISRSSIASTEFLICVPNEQIGVKEAFVYCIGTNVNFIDYLMSLASGTSNSHQRVRPNDFLDYSMALPASEILLAFDKVVAPILEKSRTARKQSRTLAALRDTLLPKLLSGEIRVPEAEEAVEEAVA